MPLCVHGYQYDCLQCGQKPIVQREIELVKYCANEVYTEMGPGHSENVFETCLALELSWYDAPVIITRQVPCPLKYKGLTVGVGFIDILINNLIVEIKAVAKITPKDVQQVQKYLDALDLDYGLLLNFGNDLEIIEVKGSDHDKTPS